jgi:hypothetical protein
MLGRARAKAKPGRHQHFLTAVPDDLCTKSGGYKAHRADVKQWPAADAINGLTGPLFSSL